jgi:NADH-quinone oxidoreductase subunit E
MLTETEKEEVARQLQRYPTRQAACIEALKIVQKHHGYVSDEHLAELAELLSMTADELDGVATFYSLIFRRPVGRHVILLCDSVSCYVMGYEDIYRHLQQGLGIEFGQTTSDGRFTLLPAPCLGCCDHAPAMMVDDDLHQVLTPERLDEILASYP